MGRLVSDDVVRERRVMQLALWVVEVAEEDGLRVRIVEGIRFTEGGRHEEQLVRLAAPRNAPAQGALEDVERARGDGEDVLGAEGGIGQQLVTAALAIGVL